MPHKDTSMCLLKGNENVPIKKQVKNVNNCFIYNFQNLETIQI